MRTQQRFAPFSNIMNELKEPQVKEAISLEKPPYAVGAKTSTATKSPQSC